MLARFLLTANAAGVTVVLSAVSEKLQAGLERNLPPSASAELLVEPNADRALERCEGPVIAARKAEVDGRTEPRASLVDHSADDLEHYLERQIRFDDVLEGLGRWLTPRQYAAGEALAGSDAPREGLQLLLSGSASGYDAAGERLYQRARGDAIWLGALDQQAMSVVADEPCRTMVLAPAARGRLEQQDEPLALTLYRYLLDGRLQALPATAREQTSPESGEDRRRQSRRSCSFSASAVRPSRRTCRMPWAGSKRRWCSSRAGPSPWAARRSGTPAAPTRSRRAK